MNITPSGCQIQDRGASRRWQDHPSNTPSDLREWHTGEAVAGAAPTAADIGCSPPDCNELDLTTPSESPPPPRGQRRSRCRGASARRALTIREPARSCPRSLTVFYRTSAGGRSSRRRASTTSARLSTPRSGPSGDWSAVVVPRRGEPVENMLVVSSLRQRVAILDWTCTSESRRAGGRPEENKPGPVGATRVEPYDVLRFRLEVVNVRRRSHR